MNGRENQNQNQACQGQWGKTTTMMPVSYTHLTLPTNREV